MNEAKSLLDDLLDALRDLARWLCLYIEGLIDRYNMERSNGNFLFCH